MRVSPSSNLSCRQLAKSLVRGRLITATIHHRKTKRKRRRSSAPADAVVHVAEVLRTRPTSASAAASNHPAYSPDGRMTDRPVIYPPESDRTGFGGRCGTMCCVMELEFLTDRLRINKSGIHEPLYADFEGLDSQRQYPRLVTGTASATEGHFTTRVLKQSERRFKLQGFLLSLVYSGNSRLASRASKQSFRDRKLDTAPFVYVLGICWHECMRFCC